MKFKPHCFRCFAALATQTRIEIVELLQKHKLLSVLEIVSYFTITQPTITYHLKYLEESGLLKSEKRGRKVYYYFNSFCRKRDCTVFS